MEPNENNFFSRWRGGLSAGLAIVTPIVISVVIVLWFWRGNFFTGLAIVLPAVVSVGVVLWRFRGNFLSGLAIVTPAVISVAVVVWLFKNVSYVTDTLLLFLPREWTHQHKGEGDMYWYWSCVAFILAALLICLVGRYGRNFLGRKIIELSDQALMQIPLLNKIYSTVKQVNESFSNNKSSFKQVVLVSFPHANSRSVAFVTGEHKVLGKEKLISVFIPTTPNPTSGFLILVPESEIIKLDISVADGIKFIISLGAISPENDGHSLVALKTETTAELPLSLPRAPK